MPLQGHHVAVDPHGRQAFFSARDAPQMVRFDVRSLALLDTVQPHASDFVGGGHSTWMRHRRLLVTTERRPYARYSGSAAKHRGRIVIRDGDTMRPIEVYESHGIAPHDIALMEDDGLVAVANYGTTWQGSVALDEERPFQYVEPRLSVIDLRSGRLIDQFAPADNAFEIRHLARTRLRRWLQTTVVAPFRTRQRRPEWPMARLHCSLCGAQRLACRHLL
jgi:hypothetical protein